MEKALRNVYDASSFLFYIHINFKNLLKALVMTLMSIIRVSHEFTNDYKDGLNSFLTKAQNVIK